MRRRTTVRDLVIRTDEELLKIRDFGETTLQEIKQRAARAWPTPEAGGGGALSRFYLFPTRFPDER
jgi:hypothetical protein